MIEVWKGKRQYSLVRKRYLNHDARTTPNIIKGITKRRPTSNTLTRIGAWLALAIRKVCIVFVKLSGVVQPE